MVLYVQFKISWTAVCPPVPAVKPTKAVLAPTVAGMLMGQEVAKDALAVRSLMLMVSVAPL